MSTESFGELLRRFRLDAGMSQTELAETTGVHHGLIGRFERDLQIPNEDQLTAFEQALGLVGSQLRGHWKPGTAPPVGTQAAGSIPAVWNAPSRNPHFTGRAGMLGVLRSRIADVSRAVILPLALHGTGGIGKTQLALEYAYRHKSDYDIVWWIDAEQPELIDVSFAELGTRLGLPRSESVPRDARDAREALRKARPNNRWLVVFDNAAEPESIAGFMPDPGECGHILITTRMRAWTAVVSAVEVDVFDRAESVERLTSGVRNLSRADAAAIAETVGDLPLAVEGATAWLAATGTPPDQYTRLLSEEPTRALAGQRAPGYPRSVTMVWNMSIDRLRTQSPLASHLLQLTAFLDPDAIATELFYDDDTIDLLSRLTGRQLTLLEVGDAIKEIVMLSLMRADSASLRIHRLIQATLIDRMEPAERIRTAHGVHLILANARPSQGDADNPESWARYALIWPHLAPSRAAECNEPTVRELLIERVRYLWNIGEFERALRFGRGIETAWTRALAGSQQPDTATTSLTRQLLRLKSLIGTVLWTAGRHRESHEIHRAVLSAQRQIMPENDVEVLHTAGVLAADLRALGEFRSALEMDLHTYEAFSEVLSADHPRVLSAANNLALSFRLCGDIRKGRELDGQTFVIRRSVLGETHPHTITSHIGIGIGLIVLGRYREAEIELRAVYEAVRRRTPQVLSETIRTATALSTLLNKIHKNDEALEIAETAYRSSVDKFGELDLESLSCAVRLSTAQSSVGRVVEGRDLAFRALAGYAESLGPLHPHTLACTSNLAVHHRRNTTYDLALVNARQAVERLGESLGEQHPYTLAASANLANSLVDTGDPAAAESIERATATAFASRLGPEHPDTLAVNSNLAATLNLLGRGDEARRFDRIIVANSKNRSRRDRRKLRTTPQWSRIDFDLQPRPL